MVVAEDTTEQVESYANVCPTKLSQNFFSFDWHDYAYLILTVCVAVYIARVHHSRLLAIVVFVGMLLCMIRRDDARAYRMVMEEFENASIRRRDKGIIFKRGQSPKKTLLRRARYAVPLHPTAIGNEIGVVYVPAIRSDAFVVVGDGSGIPFESIENQRALHDRLANVMKKVAAQQPEYSIGTSLVFYRGALNMTEIQAMFSENLHPDVVRTRVSLFPNEEHSPYDVRMGVIGANILEAQNDLLESSGSVCMAMVITIRRDRWLSAKVRGRETLSTEDVEQLLAPSLRDAAIDGLESCGIKNPRALNVDGLLAFIHRAWDLNVEEYDMWRALTSPEERRKDDEGRHWPQELIHVNDKRINTDGSYHATLRITGLPKRVLPPDFRQLHSINVPYISVTLAGETSRTNREYFWSKVKIPLKISFRQAQGRTYEPPDMVARDMEAERRQTEIWLSQFVQNFSILVAISARNPKDLERYVSVAQRDIRSFGMDCKRITGESRQLRALLCARTGINTL